jgi:hypothetical protein
MGQVGAFPTQRRIVRGAVNPYDKATVVSIYPKVVDEIKPTLFPGQWKIDAGSYTKPSLLVVGPSSWFRDDGDDTPVLEIPVSAIQIAESIVKDYCNGILESNMADRMPGLFFIPGEVDLNKLLKEYKTRLDDANVRQKNWFAALVRIADSLWARTNGNPIAIGDDMRMAAHELGLEDKPWLKDFHAVAMIKCTACGSLRDPQYPICMACKTDHSLKVAVSK